MQSIGNDPYPLSTVYEVSLSFLEALDDAEHFVQQCFGNVTHYVGCDQEEDVMKCLRSTVTASLIGAVSEFHVQSYRLCIDLLDHRPQPLCKYLPIVDGDIIQDTPTKMIAQGRFAKWVTLNGASTKTAN